MSEKSHSQALHDSELAQGRARVQEARRSQTKLAIDAITPDVIVKIANLAVEEGDARDLEPICVMLEEKEGLLEAKLGLAKGQLTNDPELSELRTLREGVERQRKEAWRIQGIVGPVSLEG